MFQHHCISAKENNGSSHTACFVMHYKACVNDCRVHGQTHFIIIELRDILYLSVYLVSKNISMFCVALRDDGSTKHKKKTLTQANLIQTQTCTHKQGYSLPKVPFYSSWE